MEDLLYKPEAVAEYLGTTTGNLAQMRYRGNGPRFVKVSGRAVRYRQSDIDAWLAAQTHQQTGERVSA